MTEFRYPIDCTCDEDIADFWAIRLDNDGLGQNEQIAFDQWQATSPNNVVLLSRAPNLAQYGNCRGR